MDTKLKNTLIKFADFFIMPSIQVGKSVEGFGISFLEAAKYGTASIGGKQGGASDIIKNKKTGLLCDGNSHEDIYKNLMLIMENNNYKVFGDNAKNYAKLFAWENQIKKYIDLIKKHWMDLIKKNLKWIGTVLVFMGILLMYLNTVSYTHLRDHETR